MDGNETSEDYDTIIGSMMIDVASYFVESYM